MAMPISKARSLQRFFFSGAAEMEPDKQGRILLPQHLREYAGLTKDVAFIGASRRAELWDAARWREFNSGLTEEAIAASENQRSSSLIYSLYMMGNTMPLADQVYILQSNVIKELAEKGSCVILGRCGDYVLRDRKDVLRTFVYAPLENRIAIAKARPDAKDMPDRLWETTLAKHDRARASYYNYYTENHWGEAKNYDLCLNAALGREVCADLIVQAAQALEKSL